MKYISKVIGILALALATLSCVKENQLSPGTFSIDMDTYSVIALDQNAQVFFVPVTTNVSESEWKFTSSASWCHVGRSITSQKGIMVSVEDNTDKEQQRRAQITVSAAGKSYTLAVVQTGYGPAIIVKNATIGPEGGELVLEVLSNVVLDESLISAPEFNAEDGEDWIRFSGIDEDTKSFSTSRFVYSIDVNEMPDKREAVVHLKALSSADSAADTKCTITQNSISVTDPEIFSDTKIKVLSVRASQVSSYEGPVEDLIDGSYETYYHSPYEVTTEFPVTLEFELFGDQRIDYINVMHRGSGNPFKAGAHWRGQFGTVKIYYKENATDEYTWLQDFDFGGRGGYQTVNLDQALENVTWIKFEVQDDSDPNHASYTDGQYVACAEVEFYTTNRAEVNDWISKIFTDLSCSEIKSGVTKKDIIKMNAIAPYLATNVAIPLFNNSYDANEKDFRIHSYEPYSDNGICKEMVTQFYTAMDNPTGVEVEEGKDIIVCLDKVPAGQSVSLRVYGEESEYGPNYGGGGSAENYDQETILQPGVNNIRIQKTGMAYVMNTAESLGSSSQPVKVHVLPGCGKVQGYYDPARHSEQRYQELLSACTYKYFVVKGEKCMFLFHTNQLRSDYPKSILSGIRVWDDIVRWEHELMGLDKHPEFNNHMMAVTSSNPDVYMNATNRRVQFGTGTIAGIGSREKMAEGEGQGSIWGPAHEMGHINQMAINWRSTTESSNNLFSNYCVKKLADEDNRYYKDRWSRGKKISDLAADFVKGTPWAVLGDGSYQGEDPELHMRMNWQLWNYYQLCEFHPDFFPDLFEYFRQPGNMLPSHEAERYGRSEDCGLAQLEYYEACCKVSGQDLTEFFEVWGFFRTIDEKYSQYGTTNYRVTTQMINASRARVRDLNLPKAAPIQYLEDRTTHGGVRYSDMGYFTQFRDDVKITKTPKATLNGKKVTLTDCDQAVAVELRKGSAEDGALMYFSNLFTFEVPSSVTLTGNTLWAVQADGQRIKIQ